MPKETIFFCFSITRENREHFVNDSDAYASNKTQDTVPHSCLFNDLVKKKPNSTVTKL